MNVWIPHTTNERPAQMGTAQYCWVKFLGEPQAELMDADGLAWGPGPGPNGEGRIAWFCPVFEPEGGPR